LNDILEALDWIAKAIADRTEAEFLANETLCYAVAQKLTIIGEAVARLSPGTHDVVSVGYVGSNGRRLLRREIGGPGSTPTALVALATDHGASDYDGLQVQYRRRVLQGFQALVSYAWTHSIDDASSDAFLEWAGNGSSAQRDRASSDFDLRHALTSAMSYEFAARGAGLRRFLGGWAIDSIVRVRSGFPISIQQNDHYQAITLANAFRPDRILGRPIWMVDQSAPGGRRIDPGAFQAAKPGIQGSLGRNAIAGFGMSQTD